MKNKFGIKTRVFLGFGFFLITIINILLYLLYLGVEDSFISGIEANIEKNYNTIKKVIDQQEAENKDTINLTSDDLKSLKDLGFFTSFGKKNEEIEKNYKLGSFVYGKEIFFRGDYKGYNIIIGKNISDFLNYKSKMMEVILYADLISVIILIVMVYLITNRLLKPLIELSKFISKYDITKNKELIKNNYGDSEIGLITDAINNLISKSKNILESQKRFIQDSSHELKTPLMQIDSNIELLEEKIEDEKILKKLENIKKSSENINKIVSNLGFILRGEENFQNTEKIDIYKYLNNLVKGFYSIANEKNIQINIEKIEDLEIENNTYFLDRLFGNLIQNAIFYNNGNSEIKIEIFKNKVILKDNGVGIKKDELEKIFDRFYRNSDSNIYNKNGSGLGLTIVKKICDDFGWEINISSEIGVGSTFEIIFKQN
ncbi:sensor histidine kinase [Candidatus Gracilibacteria bacterium]|nr:MAG: sensor histidine kinase [Candidatus Gracilibacteria bacterium]